MLLEKRLRQLSVDADSEKMYSQWNIIKSSVEEKLKTVSSHFPHFSKHDVTHSQTIATHIGNLLGEDRVNKLSYSDIFMMLLSFYYHDVGMALEYEKIYEYFRSHDFQNKLREYENDPSSDLHNAASRLLKFGTKVASDYESSIDIYNDIILLIEDIYRVDHAKRSAEAVMNDSLLNSVIHIRCQNILAKICEIHQKSISSIATLPWKENGFFGDYFHPRMIAAMLCLGDLLDLDTDRFDEITINASTPFPRLSKLHLDKHKSVRHFLVEKNSIEISADMNSIDVYRVMRKWIDWLHETCDYITLHWSEISPEDFGNAPRILKSELLLNGNTKWIPFSNVKYTISNKRMFELLKGSSIYNNKFVCIREIIQNAIDATLLRLFDEETLNGNESTILQQLKDLTWESYQICGKIEVLDNTHVSVKLRDRGIGISTDDIYKIANVSKTASSKRKTLISKMPMWLRPSGAFGMGLQSIFLLTDQFTVVTKTVNETAKKITFQSADALDGYITVEDHDGTFTQGTEISFIIDGEKLSSTELLCSSYHYKQKDLSRHIIRQIFGAYHNQHTPMPFEHKSIKTSDYVPVKIHCVLPPDGKEETLLEYTPFFSSCNVDQHIVKLGENFVEVEKFIPELNCQIVARLHLSGESQSQKADHQYGKIHDINHHFYQNALFYRNTFVCAEVLHNSFFTKAPFTSYIDWRINLLDATSDEVLKVSRNSINEDYSDIFYRKINKALEIIAKDTINYLIDTCKDEERESLGDTSLVLYQFSVQLNHRIDEFCNKFKKILERITLDNYFLWKNCTDSPKMQVKTFQELRNQELYWIVDEIRHVPSDIPVQNLDESDCLCLKAIGNAHILSHRMTQVFLGKKNGTYVKAIAAVPFECNMPNDLYEMDDIFLLENIIRMINLNLRVIPAVKGYETLITPVDSGIDYFSYGERNDPYYIEMPFAFCASEIEKILHKDGFVPRAVEKYLDLIVRSQLFDANVEYIVDITGESPTKVCDKYKSLVTKCLELLSAEKYKEFNQEIISKLDDIKTREFRDPSLTEHNAYVSYRDILLEQP